jgi:tripartite motif-containing protein 2/3/tripartite motif-containing protein 71
MAEPEKQALRKLEEEITCAICLSDFQDPKLLPCFHVFCRDCLKKIIKGEQGKASLCCPTCRRLVPIAPGSDISSLPAAFHIHHLFEIKSALIKVKEPQTVKCQKCTKSTKIACSYCRDCGEFICEACTRIHEEWDSFKTHEVIPLTGFVDRVKELPTLKKVILNCSPHPGKEIELYCETCMELICHNCTVKKHKDHQYDLVDEVFEDKKDKFVASLKPIENRIAKIREAVQSINGRSEEIDKQLVAIKMEIEQKVTQLLEILQAQKNDLMSKLQQLHQEKQKNLTHQKDDLQATESDLARCVSFVSEALKTESKGEVLKVMKVVTKQIEVISKDSSTSLLPCEPANLKFKASPGVESACKSIGIVCSEIACPSKCYATGSGLEVAVLGEKTTIVFHSVNDEGNACKIPIANLSCVLISESTRKQAKSSVKMLHATQYEISYQPTEEGKHSLQVTVDSQHIRGSPFTLYVFRKPCTPVAFLDNIRRPYAVVVDGNGRVIISEMDMYSVAIYSPVGQKIDSFLRQATISGFKNPKGLAVDSTSNLYVVDGDNHRIRKFTTDRRHLSTVGKEGNKRLEFRYPSGVGIHPKSGRIYITDTCNHRIQILNSNLTFVSTFGSNGSSNGEFSYPQDVSFDSDGNVYVVDNSNHRIQVFESDGKFLRTFGKHGSYDGELNYPVAISVDCSKNDVVYVTDKDNHRISMFTSEGKFITSFGGKGTGVGQFDMPHGITAANNGVLYVCDFYNNRIQLFQ